MQDCTPPNPASAPTKDRRNRWLVQGSSMAIAFGLCFGAPSEAQAQRDPTSVLVGAREDATRAAQGNFTATPAATITRSANRDVVSVNTNAAILNWTTLDTATLDSTTDFINFLPAGTTLAFEGPGSEFTVLNRIFGTPNAAGQYRGIAMSGTVTSNLSNGGPVGGSIWFYAPGGIFLGNGAAFNVGSLILTASDLDTINTSDITFNGAVDPFAKVIIGEGANITLPNEASTFLVVAPTIEQRGTVNVNGSVLYFITDTANIDIDTSTGEILDWGGLDTNGIPNDREGRAEVGNYILHTGITTGPASNQVVDINGAVLTADPHEIIFDARNNPLEMYLSGQIGYQAAGAAATGPNGEVILSARFNGLVEFGATQFSSQVTSNVVRTRFNLQAGETFSVLGDGYANYGLDLALGSLLLDIPQDATFSIAGDLNLTQLFPSSDTIRTLGTRRGRKPIVIELASGSRFAIGGNFTIDNSAGSDTVGGVDDTPGEFDTDNIVQGGDIFFRSLAGSEFTVGGNFLLDTSVTAGAVGGVVFGAVAGDIVFSSAGTFSVGGSTRFNASASPLLEGAATGGYASSGSVFLTFAGTSTLNDVIIDNGATATGSGYGGDATASLNATSQYASITFNGGSHTWTSLTIDGAAVGGQGAPGQAGGRGWGTDVGFYLYGDSQVTIPTITIDGSGTGGRGGEGGAGGVGLGGYGRMVVGSNATLGVTDLTVAMDGVGGVGGIAGFSSPVAGVSGSGTGGFFYTYLYSTISGLQNLSITATGTGGAGASGYAGSGSYPGSDGGDGFGGTVEVNLYGTGTTLQGLTSLTLDVTGTGGAGAAGGYGFLYGVPGTNGGNGTGGSLTISANQGALIDLSVVDSLSADGRGGAGGAGVGYYGGATAGGNGGNGYGGTLHLSARGGTITGDNIDLSASGIGGAAGTGGYYYGPVNPYYGADGASGGGSGGTVRLSALEGSPGVISLGAVSIDASGILGGTNVVPTVGGSIILEDASTSAGGNISMTSLTATALGAGTAGTFTASSTSGPISVTNDVSVNVSGDILFDFANDGQLVAGGATTLTAGGNIGLTHTANTLPVFSIDTGGALTATAGGNFTVDTGGIVNAGGTANVRAEGDIFVNDIRGVTNVILSAGGNNTVNDATVTGPPTTIFVGDRDVAFSGLFIIAGSDNGTTPIYDPTANATITGTLTSSGRVQVTAGGSAFFRSGSSTLSDNALFVNTGDDIVIESGASLAAALNPSDTPATDPFTDPANLRLEAGSITALSSPRTTPISSLVIGGTVDANAFGMVLTGNAIDARGSTLNASSIQADINDAPALGVAQSDDNGLLTDPCLEGDICLGAISADNRVWIGQNSNNGVLSLLVESGTVAADSILVTTLEDVVFGTSGINSTFGATTEFIVESLAGDVNLLDAAITSDRIAITAAGSLLGSGSLTSANDIGITVGADLNAAVIDTGGQLTTVAGIGGGLEAVYTVAGSIAVGALTQDALTAANFTAGGDISFGSITTQNQAIVLTANSGSAFLGTTTQAGAASIDISAQDVSFNDLAASGAITLTSSVGAITGTTAGSLTAGGPIALDAATNIAVGALSAGTDIALLAAGTIDFASASAAQGGIAMTAGGAITGGDVTTTDSALATDDVTITAGALLTLGNVVSGEGMTLQGTGAVTGDLTALSGGVDLDAGTGAADLGFVTALGLTSGTIDISGNAVTLAGASSDLGMTITATGGDLVATGDLTSGAGAVLDAGGAVTLQNLAAGGAIAITSGAATSFLTVGTSSGSVNIDAGGAISGDSITTTANAVTLDDIVLTAGGLANVASLVAGDAISVNAAGFTSNSAIAGTDLTVTSSGAVAIAGATTGGIADLTGTSVDLGASTIGGNLLIDATAGNAVFAGLLTVGGNATIGATVDITGGDLSAGGAVNITAANVALGDVSGANGLVINAAGDVGFGTLSTDNDNVEVTAGGSISGVGAIARAVAGDGGLDRVIMDAGGDITLTGTVQSVFDGVFLTAGGAIDIATLDANDNLSVVAGGALTVGDIVQRTGGFAVDLAGTIVTLGTLDSVAAVTIDAATAAIIGTASSGNAFTVTSGGDVTFGTITTDNGNAQITAAGSILGGDIAALAVGGDGGLDRVILDAGGDITLTGTAQSVFDGIFLTAGGAIDAAVLDANDNLILDAGGAITVGSAFQRTANLAASFSGSSVTIGTADTVSDLSLLARAGDILATGQLASDGTVTLTASNAIGVQTIDAGSGITAFAGGNVTFGTLATLDGPIAVDAGGLIAGGIVQTLAPTGDAGDDSVTLTAAGDVTLTGTSASSSDFLVNAGGAVSLAALQAGGDLTVAGQSIAFGPALVGGDMTLDASGGDILGTGTSSAGGAIQLSASGDIGFDRLEAQGGQLLADAGGAITFGSVLAQTNVDLIAGAGIAASGDIQAGTSILLDTATGSVAVRDLLAPGDIRAAIGDAGGSFTARNIVQDGGALVIGPAGSIAFGDATGSGSVSMEASGAIDFASIDTSGLASLVAGGALTGTTLAAGGDIALSAADILLGSASTAGNFDATTGAAGGLQVGQLVAGGAVSADTGAGGIVINALSAASGDLLTSGDLVIEEADVAGLLALEAANAFVRSSGSLDMAAVATLGTIDVGTAGSLSGTFTAVQDILLDAGRALNLAAASAGRDIALASGGDLTISGGITAQRDLSARSGGDVLVAAGSSMAAGNALTIDAANALRTGGLLTGVTIDVTAGDVAIDTAAGGRIGESSVTQLITFTSNGAPVVLGGGDAADAFSLSQAEIDAIHSGGDLVINGPSILVRDTAVQVATGSDAADDGTIGVGGTLSLNSGSNIRIEGMLSMTGAGANNTLALDAANLLHIETTAGGISMLDSDGELAGSVTISAADFIAATDAALEDIAGMSLAEIEARLAQNDGVLRPDGVIQADGLVIATSGGPILVQNTGAGTDFDQRRGFSVNSLTVSYGGGTNVPVVLNGVISGTTGIDAIALANIPAGFDPGSTFNGCLIGNVASCLPVIEEPRIRFEQEIQSLIEERILGGEDASFSGGEDGPGDELGIDSMLIGMAEQEEFDRDPLIDEPVTGAGNEDLWNAFNQCGDEEESEDNPLCLAEEREPAE